MSAEPKVFFVDNSMIELMTTCPWKSWASFIARRRRNREEPALRFGTHIHAATALRDLRECLGQSYTFSEQVALLEAAFTNTPCENEEWRNFSTASEVVRAYNQHWGLEHCTTVKLKDGTPAVELSFALEAGKIGDVQVVYAGRIDRLVTYPGEGLFVFDRKTASIGGETFWQDKEMNPQGRGYCWACRESPQIGQEPTGYVIDQLLTRPPSKTGTAIEFARRKFFTKEPPGQLDRWFQNMMAQVETFLWHQQRGVFPRHHAFHCINKYGSCEFLKACEEKTEAKSLEVLAGGDFKSNTWSPLASPGKSR